MTATDYPGWINKISYSTTAIIFGTLYLTLALFAVSILKIWSAAIVFFTIMEIAGLLTAILYLAFHLH